MVSKKSRSEVRRKKHMKLRNRFSGTAERPRLAVFRSNNRHVLLRSLTTPVGNTLGCSLHSSERCEGRAGEDKPMSRQQHILEK